MPYFLVHALYAPGTGEARETQHPVHKARLRNHDHPVTVHIGGPLLNDEGAKFGTMLVIEAASKAEVETFMKADPYVDAGIYATIDVHPFLWGTGAPE